MPSNQPAPLPRALPGNSQAPHSLGARPAFGNFLVHRKAKKCKGNKFQKSSADGNMSSPAPGRGAGFDRRGQPALLGVTKTDLGMLISIN